MITHKIFGPPGVGKTTRLIELVQMEVQMGITLPQIAYLSFTKSAREVILERLNAKEEDVRWFRTIHGASTKVMGFSGAIIGWSDYADFSRKTGMRITPEELDDYDDGPNFNITLRALNLAANQMRPVQEVIREMNPHPNLAMQRVEHFDKAWNDYKRSVRRFDYMDMLTKYDGSPIPGVKIGMLDEGQDLTKLQWKIVHDMFKQCERFYMAGDDDQSIYKFIGADEYGFLDHQCDEEEILPRSYRVPQGIGKVADQIIRKIKHRKEKKVQWKRAPGDVQRLNLDALTIPWKQWIARYPRMDEGTGIMVLCRNRIFAKHFSDDLKSIGVPHSLNGESLTQWREAKHVITYMALKEGRSVTPKAAQALLEEAGRNGSRFGAMARRDKVTAQQIEEINFSHPWVSVLAGGDNKKWKRYEALRKLIAAEGSEILAREPTVMISTMHAAKGKESDLVIIVPDCTPIVRQHMLDATEARLAYVALTRAKRQAFVLAPRGDLYMPHFFGG